MATRRIPSFSRQTKLACSACHYGFPQLTPFGRLFKLNGYTLTGLTTIEASDSVRQTLKLAPFPPVSAMAIVSLTNTHVAVPETQNNSALFPDQASIFLAGEVTPKFGAFVQFTYSGADASFGIDNTEFRFADHGTLGSKPILFGFGLNNNPTMQDVWNTTPAWGYPFVSSEIAPAPAAGLLIDGGLGQQVLGVGGYALWNNHIYAEFSAYTSAPQGGNPPLNAANTNVSHNLIPYWRLAYQTQWGANYLMVGTYGMQAHLFPTGVTGLTNRYTDIAGDAQFEHRLGEGVIIGRATFIHEAQELDAFVHQDTAGAANLNNNLDLVRVSASWMPSTRYNVTAGYFSTTGTSDAILYPADPITGSATGSPNSSGGVGEFDFNAWQNVRLGIQYIAYGKFNGGSTSYDAAGRNASDNNTLYMFIWIAF